MPLGALAPAKKPSQSKPRIPIYCAIASESSTLEKTHDLFFERAGLDRHAVQSAVDESLAGADDGELFLEYRQSESFVFDDGRLKAATFDTMQGFGLRAVAGEATGYAHACELSEAAIRRAGKTVQAVTKGYSG